MIQLSTMRVWLDAMGLDHERLTFRLSGRGFRLTDVHGRVVNGIVA